MEVVVPAAEGVGHRVAVAGAALVAEERAAAGVEEEQAGVAGRAAPPVAVPVEGVDQPAGAEYAVEGRPLLRTMRR